MSFVCFLVVVFMVAAFSYLYLHRHLRRCLAAGRMHFAYTITLKTSTTTITSPRGVVLKVGCWLVSFYLGLWLVGWLVGWVTI